MTQRPFDDPGSGDRMDDDDTGTPRWVKAFGIVALVLVLAFVVLHLAGGGFGHHIAEHLR